MNDGTSSPSSLSPSSRDGLLSPEMDGRRPRPQSYILYEDTDGVESGEGYIHVQSESDWSILSCSTVDFISLGTHETPIAGNLWVVRLGILHCIL